MFLHALSPRTRRAIPLVAVVLALGVVFALWATTPPEGQYLELPGEGYVTVDDTPSLDITGSITLEAWVYFEANTGCESILGKQWTVTFWLGNCSGILRSYLQGSGSSFDAGTIPFDNWTHVAMTYNGFERRHYIDGVLAGFTADTGPLPVNDADFQIGRDVAWTIIPTGRMDEVRVWNVARSASQIQGAMNQRLTSPQTGLVGVWGFEGTADATVGTFDTSLIAPASISGTPFSPDPPPGPWLTSSEVPGFRFKVRITPPGQPSIAGDTEPLCITETACISGAIPGRAEVFIRVIGPRPNGFLWPNLVKFTPSQVEVWIEQLSSGQVNYYNLEGAAPGVDELPGLFDREGFAP